MDPQNPSRPVNNQHGIKKPSYPPPPPPPPPVPPSAGGPVPVEHPKPQVARSLSIDSGVGVGDEGEFETEVSESGLDQRKAEVIDPSVKILSKKKLTEEQVANRDKLLKIREDGIGQLRDIMASQWIKTQAPEIIRAIQDPQYAIDHNIRIVLVVDGVPAHITPPNPADKLSQEDLQMYREYVQQSLALYDKTSKPLDFLGSQIEKYESALHQIDHKLKEYGVQINQTVESDMLKKSTVVVVDFSKWDNPVVWGGAGNIPDSAIGLHKSFLQGGEIHLIRDTDEGIEQSDDLGNASSWDDFDDEVDDRGNVDLDESELPLHKPLSESEKEALLAADEPFDPDPDYEQPPARPPVPSYEEALTHSKKAGTDDNWGAETLGAMFQKTGKTSSPQNPDTPPLSGSDDGTAV